MKFERLPNKRYATICGAMEEEGWISHAVACCVGDYGKERLLTSLKRSRTFLAYKAGMKPPIFDDSTAQDLFLVYMDVNGAHPTKVRVNRGQSLVRSINGSNNYFSVGYLDDLRAGLKMALQPRLK
jgi:hypothetical protein